MGRPRKPIAVLKAEGKSHMTKEQIEKREAEELDVPFKDIKPPAYLNKNQKKKFKEIAGKLLALGIMTELDVDCLARYIISQDLYIAYTKAINDLLEKGEFDDKLQNMQDKAFRQAQATARTMGLTITDRCKIIIPVPPEDEDDEL